MAAATARKLPVVTSDPADLAGEGVSLAVRGGVSLATADLTMGMLISLAYRLIEADRYTRAGHFKQEQTLALMGIGCPGKTVGLIGLGKVARYMVPRIRAFDMHILYTKRTRLPREEEREHGLEWAGLDELLQRSDFICVECDYNPQTHKLIGAREFALMKPSAYLINTARGRIVDEPELIRALRNRTIAGAALRRQVLSDPNAGFIGHQHGGNALDDIFGGQNRWHAGALPFRRAPVVSSRARLKAL
jgi:glyoxylate reductase